MSYVEGTYEPEFFVGIAKANTESSGDIVRTRKVYELSRAWENPQTISKPSEKRMDVVVYDGSYFVSVAAGVAGEKFVFNSSNSTTWNTASSTTIPNAISGIRSIATDGKGKIVVCCMVATGNGRSYYSTDHGVTWGTGNMITGGSTDFRIFYSSYWDKFFATSISNTESIIRISTDGITWTQSSNIGAGAEWFSVAINEITGRILLVRTDGGSCMVTNDCGQTWYATGTIGGGGLPSNAGWTAGIGNTGLFFVETNSPDFRVSYDGIKWLGTDAPFSYPWYINDSGQSHIASDVTLPNFTDGLYSFDPILTSHIPYPSWKRYFLGASGPTTGGTSLCKGGSNYVYGYASANPIAVASGITRNWKVVVE